MNLNEPVFEPHAQMTHCMPIPFPVTTLSSTRRPWPKKPVADTINSHTDAQVQCRSPVGRRSQRRTALAVVAGKGGTRNLGIDKY